MPGFRKNDSRRGSQLVEGALMMLPFLALAFLTLDSAWAIFVKASLRHAVNEGVRYAVTGRTSNGQGQIASIKSVVQTQAFGLLAGAQGGTLSVQFLDSSTLAPTNNNQGGNLVTVAVTNYQLKPMAPLLRSGAAIPISVTATDRIEGSPGGVAPTP